MSYNWAGLSIALGIITAACTIVPWPLLIVGAILLFAYKAKR